MTKLKPCPCGKTPSMLQIFDGGQGGKWDYAAGDCCGEWHIEFKNSQHNLTDRDSMISAIDAWNDAPRK